MSESSIASLPASERMPTLDILRGFALMGILIMNMPGFSSSFFAEADGSHLWPGVSIRVAERLRDMLFSGKFNSMFSLLFGIGFTIQFTRMQARDPATRYRHVPAAADGPGGLGVLHAACSGPVTCCTCTPILGLVARVACATSSDRASSLLMGLCLLYPAVSGTLRLLL